LGADVLAFRDRWRDASSRHLSILGRHHSPHG
jgi:hypothetical protein